MVMRAKIRNKRLFGQAALIECPKQYAAGRKCKRCHKTLSIFNEGENCFSYCGNEEMKRYG